MEMVRAFERASGKSIPYEIVARRPGDVGASYATCERAERELNWKSRMGIDDMCEWTVLVCGCFISCEK